MAARLGALYEQHAARLTRRVLLMVGDVAAAQDLVQETFVTAFERHDQVDAAEDPQAWLWGVARHKVLNHVRKRSRRRSLWARFGRAEVVEGDPTAEDHIAADDAWRQLDAAMSRLEPELRACFVLRHIEQLPLERCAAELDTPLSTVSSRARRAAEIVRASFLESDERKTGRTP